MFPFFFLILRLSKSWNDETLTIATEIMFRNLGDTGPSLIKQVLALSNEKLERLSLAGSWLSYLERPPFNTDCFNHWRYVQNPIGTPGVSHSNDDDLKSTLAALTKGISTGTISGSWAYHFSFKTLLTLFLEAFSPIHTVEYFSIDFPDGDNSGRNYTILYQGKKMTLHDFWDTGCGQYMNQYPFNSENWKKIDSEVTNLIKGFPSGSGANTDIDAVINQSIQIAIDSIYTNSISPNSELPSEYVNNCKTIVSKRIPYAAYSLAKFLKGVNIPSITPPLSKNPINTSEAIGWAIMCLLVPLTSFLLCDYFHKMIKTD